jgi:myo-inositol-1(or 4)-monophosphatase
LSPDWRSILLGAASEATAAVRGATKDGSGSKALGVGASGDRTLGADRAAEEAILAALSAVGDLRVVSEEKGEFGPSDAAWVAVVDPVDGSSNYARGIPFFCTSIAVCDGPSLSSTRFGVVQDLAGGSLYYAERGKGAEKDGAPVRPSGAAELSKAMVAIDISRADRASLSRVAPVISAAKSQSHLGSSALELCMVAEGKIDAMVDARGRIRSTDFAAAYLIAREAGVLVTDVDGSVLDPPLGVKSRFSFVAAANEPLQSQILALLME